MASKPTAAVARAMASSAHSTPADKLLTLQTYGAEARDLMQEIAQIEEDLKKKQQDLLGYLQNKMPSLMSEIGLDNVGIPANGNMPGFDYELSTYYSANIAAAWEPEKKVAAFAFLKKHKADDLIKTKVEANLPKGSLKKAKALAAAAKKLGIKVNVTESVHSGTLTAWLREFYKKGKTLPKADLEKIGASIGQIVKPQERKE